MNLPDAVRAPLQRLRHGWVPILESTAAATGAWLIDTRLVGHTAPFFAPAAALIVLGQARGQRLRRTVEVLLGVAGGVLLADVVAQALGPHTTWTVLTVILLTLVATVALGASAILTVQAAVSALYVAVVTPGSRTIVPVRFIDALIGGVVAVVVSHLAVARDPLSPLLDESRKLFDELAGVLEDVAAALDRHDESAAREALNRSRRADDSVQRLDSAVAAAGEALRLDLRRRQRLGGVQALDTATRQIDLAVRNVRVLARAAVNLTRSAQPPPAEVADALRTLAEAVRAVDDSLAAELMGLGDEARQAAGKADAIALEAVRRAGALLRQRPPFPVVMIVGSLRSTVIDLLRATGGDDLDVLDRVDDALGLSA